MTLTSRVPFFRFPDKVPTSLPDPGLTHTPPRENKTYFSPTSRSRPHSHEGPTRCATPNYGSLRTQDPPLRPHGPRKSQISHPHRPPFMERLRQISQPGTHGRQYLRVPPPPLPQEGEVVVGLHRGPVPTPTSHPLPEILRRPTSLPSPVGVGSTVGTSVSFPIISP